MKLLPLDLYVLLVKYGVIPVSTLERWEPRLSCVTIQLNKLLATIDAPSSNAEADAIVEWAANASELTKLQLYKYLNLLGYRMSGIDSKIAEEERKLKQAAAKP